MHPAGNVVTALMPCSAWAWRILRTEPVMSLGSTSRLRNTRHGWARAAAMLCSLIPTSPASTPTVSIRLSVMVTGSWSSSTSSGTSLNMYPAGMAMLGVSVSLMPRIRYPNTLWWSR